jgi:hypothetical protein
MLCKLNPLYHSATRFGARFEHMCLLSIWQSVDTADRPSKGRGEPSPSNQQTTPCIRSLDTSVTTALSTCDCRRDSGDGDKVEYIDPPGFLTRD